ncbi:hypothetical protein [Deinococcus actinosclerus]|uniref:Uncharacterized protein n=1 Tax=Deinococcus actinosclerus TaxID=1768108 RepID=A0ABN4K9Z7_9DEIO|nr:hypothetical protein [Deinococcus actinosclerus]ALW90070.1 hypothetical protein AUC44_15195 [Deinococcus actinosclerus]
MTARRTGLAWLLTAGLSVAGAQNLSAYGALATQLDGAVQARAQSAEAALNRLDAAGAALDQLAPTLRNQQIVSGLRDALDRSRGALARTPAELQAQVLLARGLMRKALYDQSLAALGGQPADEDAQLRVLAREFGLTGAAAQALSADVKAGQLERAAWRLQRSAVQKVSAALQATQAQQTTAAYVNLARATGWFTVVQDSSSAGSLKLSQFGDALRQLTGGDTAALTTSLTTLRQGAQAFSRALATPPAPSGTAGAAPTPRPGPATDAAGSASGQTGAETGSAQTGGAKTGAQEAAGAAPVTPSPATPATGGADAAYAALGRALGASSHGDPQTTRAALQEAATQLGRATTPLRDTAEYAALQRALDAAQTRAAPRPSDVQALIGGLANAEQAARGEGSSALNRAALGTAGWFSGWLRALVFLLLGLGALAPLYLLNLAFGGRNMYWRAITAGLVLLLLPLFLEGIFGFLGALGDTLGGGALAALSNVTLSQGAYALPIWALVALAALGLLTYGFRGLCVQFGLMGDQGGAAQATVHHTAIDWDEDV